MNSFRKKGIEKISELLDLELNYSHAKHNFELGVPLEHSLRYFFRPYFPDRYGFSTGYIVDREENVSNQSDWIVYDKTNFTPILANIHGTEGCEWLPFESIYGIVEVKRTLTEKSLKEAVEQISRTRKLSRPSTTPLQITPYIRFPENFLNIAPDTKFNEVCNHLYAGIYAYLPGDFESSRELHECLRGLVSLYGVDGMPDFIAVHGRHYTRKGICDPVSNHLSVSTFIERMNGFFTMETGRLTAGVFCEDLLYQYSNTLLSADFHTNSFSELLKLPEFTKIRFSLF